MSLLSAAEAGRAKAIAHEPGAEPNPSRSRLGAQRVHAARAPRRSPRWRRRATTRASPSGASRVISTSTIIRWITWKPAKGTRWAFDTMKMARLGDPDVDLGASVGQVRRRQQPLTQCAQRRQVRASIADACRVRGLTRTQPHLGHALRASWYRASFSIFRHTRWNTAAARAFSASTSRGATSPSSSYLRPLRWFA